MSAVDLQVRPDHVLVVSVEGELDGSQVRRYLDAMAELLAVGEPFALLTVYPGARPRKDAEGHRLEKDWLAAHRRRLRGTLVAVGLVHRAGPVRRIVERAALSGAGRRLFGCPCRAMAELDEAAEWAAALVAAARAETPLAARTDGQLTPVPELVVGGEETARLRCRGGGRPPTDPEVRP